MKWYIIHVHSGFEQKVAQSIHEKAEQKGLTEAFGEIIVPTEKYLEVRRGKKTEAERKFFPGYVVIQMDLNDHSWNLVKNIAKVTGFLGGGNKPHPVPKSEVERIKSQVEEGIARPKSSIVFETGDAVKVIDGPFETFIGNVESVDEEKERLQVSVSIFGRPTPVELEYSQVEKV